MTKVPEMDRFALIIPCYNFAAGLPRTLESIENWRRTKALGAIVHFVDDGSTDETPRLLEEFASRRGDWARVTTQPRNKGKGAAIRAGFKTALAQDGSELRALLFTDCDLHYGLEIINDRILPGLIENDVVTVDRSWSLSAKHQSLSRRLASGSFNRAMAILTGVTFRDSQAGLKGFKIGSCRPIFELLTLDGFAFDVEALSIALFYRLRVLQIPVRFARTYEFPQTSSVRIVRSSLKMFADLIKINFNWKTGKYQNHELASQVERSVYSIE